MLSALSTHLSTIDSNIYLHSSASYFLKISFSSTQPPPAVELLPISAQLTMATYNHGLSFDFMYANPSALVFGCLYPSSARLAWLAAQGVELYLVVGRNYTKAHKMHPTSRTRDNINAGD